MRQFVVTMKETKFYIVHTDNDDMTPEDMASEFLGCDEERTMQIVLAGTGERELEVVELCDPNEHFYGDDDLDGEPWDYTDYDDN